MTYYDSLASNKIVGVIVTYNPNLKVLNEVIKSAKIQLSKLIIVDNASKNSHDICLLCREHEEIVLLAHEKNEGLAKAQNYGMQYAFEETNVTHAILFDQDSIIGDSFISELISVEMELLENGKKVAAVGPSFYDPNSMKTYPATLYKGFFIKKIKINKEPIEATFIISSGCMISRAVFTDVGKMKEELFIDYIDVEWCLRAKDKGYSVFIAPKATMRHTIGDKRLTIMGRAVSVHSEIRRYFLVRNSLLMLRLSYIPLGYKFREICFNVLRVAIGFFASEKKYVFLKNVFFALKDGINGKGGGHFNMP